ncbi:MAG: Esterase/lipase [Anaerocolumna sp.]|nr:Esterase/lipase [Anaerocolumna sp.]
MAIGRFKKMALKVLTAHLYDLKKNYKLHRKVILASHPYIKPLYNLLDRKIMVGDREIPVRIFKPKKAKEFKVLLFFHGGGWVTGNIDSYTNICANMAEQTVKPVSLNLPGRYCCIRQPIMITARILPSLLFGRMELIML